MTQNQNNKSYQESSFSRGGKGKGMSDSEDLTNTMKQSAEQTHASQKHNVQNDDAMQIDQEMEPNTQVKIQTQNSIQLQFQIQKTNEGGDDVPMDTQ